MSWSDISMKGRRFLLAAVGREFDVAQEPPREWFRELTPEDLLQIPVGMNTILEIRRWINEVPRVRTSCALYRHFDATGNLLYAGIALKPITRQAQHSNRASWFTEVVRIEIEWFDLLENARAAEIRAIRDENPTHNLMRPSS